MKECICGSGKEQYGLYDARGIYCCAVCDDCEEEKRSKYRVDIFTDANYRHDEQLEFDY